MPIMSDSALPRTGNADRGRIVRMASAILIACLLAFAVCLANLSQPAQAFAKGSITPTTANGKTFTIASKKVSAWLDNYYIGSSQAYLKTGESGRPRAATLRWKSKGKVHGAFTVKLSTSKRFSRSIKVTTRKHRVHVKNLLANKTYYWRVSAKIGGKRVTSVRRSFKTAASPRTIKVPKVSNMRDIGGWHTEDGRRVKQGKVYRCATMDGIGAKGRAVMLKTLGIKTELDLRKPGEGRAGTSSPLGKRVKYRNVSGVMYEGVWASKDARRRLVKEVKVFASRKNYPIVFHCTYGRDRTGTLAFVLEALLGVPITSLYQDYELSAFSVRGSAGNFTVAEKLAHFDQLVSYFSSYGTATSLSQGVEQFLIDNGMTKAQIKRIRSIMLK